MQGPSDTDPKVARMQIELLRQMSPSRRLHIMVSLSEAMIQLSRQNLERKLGSAQAAKIEWVRLNYGEDLAQQFEKALG